MWIMCKVFSNTELYVRAMMCFFRIYFFSLELFTFFFSFAFAIFFLWTILISVYTFGLKIVNFVGFFWRLNWKQWVLLSKSGYYLHAYVNVGRKTCCLFSTMKNRYIWRKRRNWKKTRNLPSFVYALVSVQFSCSVVLSVFRWWKLFSPTIFFGICFTFYKQRLMVHTYNACGCVHVCVCVCVHVGWKPKLKLKLISY